MKYSSLPSANYPNFTDMGKAVQLPVFVSPTHSANTL